MQQARIDVHADHRGGWEVSVPGRPAAHVRCDSLDEAERVARRYARRKQPCDIVVHDAYEHVLRRELVAPDGSR
jgi:hypothetical protein